MVLMSTVTVLGALILSDAAVELDPVVVTARDLQAGQPQAVAELNETALQRLRPTHPAELFARLPGAWITRGSGQEHLSAVRSPLLTGAGGCGALLILEDGIPIRPPGFCNVNNFFEVDLAQAGGVAVLRGPGGLGHASGGLHGVIDVSTRPAGPAPAGRVALEAGSDDYLRAQAERRFELGRGGVLRAYGSVTDAGSFRRDEGYRHEFLTLRQEGQIGPAQVTHVLSTARLDQDTAGFVTGFRAYRDARRNDNENPEAFRRGSAVRALSRWQWLDADGGEVRLSGFARRSRMTFLQHFLPGKPLERNGQLSTGAQLDLVRPAAAVTWLAGVDTEVFRGFLYEEQFEPAAGVPPVSAIRPLGRHYDYEVDGVRLGGYVAGEVDLPAGFQLRAGLHAEWIRYDYQTALAPGNTAEDGSTCDFGGCLYNRPADRSDDFANLAPELTLSRDLGDAATGWLRLARGFRAPQATELYRLQRGQDVAALDSEILDAVELGLRGGERTHYELVGFYQRKRNFIFRDAEGFNVSDGRTAHYGLEGELSRALGARFLLAARATLVRHRYRFEHDLGGERIESGQDIPSAPRRLFSADLNWRGPDGLSAQLALEWIGRYYLDAANSHRYPGHRLWHLFAEKRFDNGWFVNARARNLLDRRYAERADFAFGGYRYFPGPGRSLFLTVGVDWD